MTVDGPYLCYTSDTSFVTSRYLNMENYGYRINAIGSESMPFYGYFDGKNVEIKNLDVYADPQDAGLFGYTAHGSIVENLFLSDVNIHATGYTSEYNDLYGASSAVGNGACFSYDKDPDDDNDSPVSFTSTYTETEFAYFAITTDGDNDFAYDAVNSDPTPAISVITPSSNTYTFSSLISGDLIAKTNDGKIVPNLTRIFTFFKDKKETEGQAFPLQATSTVSLIASMMDQYGQKHSKVVLSLELNFTLESVNSSYISMGVHIASDHGNNIGLIIGHCDGTLRNCYVCNGSFKMNDGGNGYNKLPNGSNLGLVGRVGNTVQNILAKESDVGVKEGKNIGVLDFTTIYGDIINSTSFKNSTTPAGLTNGVTYKPISTSKYLEYLRNFNNQNITLEEDAVSFKGRSIITNTDLGVFTIATDAATTGTDSNSGINLSYSCVESENLAINGNYYIYYSTGEYNKTYASSHGSEFSNYIASFNSGNTTAAESHILPGYHFPARDQFSRESFATREARQNYFVRFKLDPSSRQGRGFYFSDLNIDSEGSDGNVFMSNYFSYKLVDQNSQPIPTGNGKCGVMLKTNLRQEVDSLSASFKCPDLRPQYGLAVKAYCLEDEDDNKYVSNMVNFEVKNDLANVTIIAAPSDRTLPSALGVYRLDDDDFKGSIDYEQGNYNMTFSQSYSDPDYAFFMPADQHLSYFDYSIVDGKGEIGTYNSSGSFDPLQNKTDAVVAKENGLEEYPYSLFSGSARTAELNKARLFAHTFSLPKGRYCIGSASSDTNHCVPKIYYICAQGQDDGQFDFDETVFSSNDVIENVDFLDRPRFDEDGTENIIIETVTTYDPDSPTDGNKLANRRCYIDLVNSDRSLFGDSDASDLSFTFDSSSGKFLITTTLAGQTLLNNIIHVAVNNYKPTLSDGSSKDLTVVLLGIESNEEVIVYPVTS